MTAFKQDLLSRFVGTDEGDVTEYLGCEIIRDRKARTAKIVQSGYAERVLKTFGMWDCKPVATPLDPN
jgi:V8-like Glu-specific endopeptidase